MTRFAITRRQALFLFVICTISSKLQTLPCLISENVGGDLWIVLLFGAVIDVAFFALVILLNNICPNLTAFDLLCKTIGKFLAKIVMIALIVYFLFTALMPYEAVRNVFANNLFDTLPWQSFSIFLIFAVGYLVFCGLKTIGRSAELYLVILVTCVGILFLLGIFSANFENILNKTQASTQNLIQINHDFIDGGNGIEHSLAVLFDNLLPRLNEIKETAESLKLVTSGSVDDIGTANFLLIPSA